MDARNLQDLRNYGIHGADAADEIDRLRAKVESLQADARPLDEWHEDVGNVLWWRFPINEPPYVGSPLDSDWPGYHTHWTPIICPSDPTGEQGSQRGERDVPVEMLAALDLDDVAAQSPFAQQQLAALHAKVEALTLPPGWLAVDREKLERIADGIYSKRHNAQENGDAYDVGYFGKMLEDLEAMLGTHTQAELATRGEGE